MYNSIKHVATDASDDSNIDIKFQERVFSFMVRKTREDALKTRQSIMDVAKKIFSERGYEKTNLTDIAEAANVTRGAIYWYFKNKDELFIDLCKELEHKENNVFHSIEFITDTDNSSLQKLREWLYSLSLLLRNKDNVDFLKIVHSVIWGNHGSAKVQKMIKEISANHKKNYVMLIREAIKKNELPDNIDVVQASDYICSVVLGYIIHYLDGTSSQIVDNNRVIVDHIINSIHTFKKQ